MTLHCALFQCRRQRNKRVKSQAAPALSAGEAIERMLVERKISTKINYDVLRDLANGLAVEGGPSNHHSSPSTSESLLTISKTPPTSAGRLPSLTTRKRNFSALMAEPTATSSQLPAKSVTILLQRPLTLDLKLIVQVWAYFFDSPHNNERPYGCERQ